MSKMKNFIVQMLDAAERWGRERPGLTDEQLWARARDMAGPQLMGSAPQPGEWLITQLREAYDHGVQQAGSDALYGRLPRAVEVAQLAFWTALGKAYPEVTTGDLDPLATFQFDQAVEHAARAWLTANFPANVTARQLDLVEVARLLHDEHDLPSAWLSYSGNCATLCAGPIRYVDGKAKHAAVAGPGWLREEDAAAGETFADVDQFRIGPDSFSSDSHLLLPADADEALAARVIAAQAKRGNPAEPLGADELTALGLDPAHSRTV